MFSSKAQAAAWLSGIIDGEGSISARPVKGTRGFVREVRITNTDRELLGAAHEALDLLGIPWVEYDRSERERLGTKPIYDIVVSRRENLLMLQKVLTLRSGKAAQLDAAISSYIRGPSKKPAEDVLRALCETKSDREIGAKYGVSAGAVWFWRKEYGITR